MPVNKGAGYSFIDQSIGVWGHSFQFLLTGGISGDGEVLWHSIFMIVHSYTEEHSLNWEEGHQTGMEGTEEIECNLSAVMGRPKPWVIYNWKLKYSNILECITWWRYHCEWWNGCGYIFATQQEGFGFDFLTVFEQWEEDVRKLIWRKYKQREWRWTENFEFPVSVNECQLTLQ